MPLRDHFHKQWVDAAPWESVGSFWVTNVARRLNQTLPKSEFRSFAHLHLGHMVEADVAEFEHPDRPANGETQVATLPTPVLTYDPEFPDEFEVRINTIRDGMKLVAVIEFVSPSNKDRAESRQKFVSKCLGYLQLGVGLVIVDTITNRHANFHNELLGLTSKRKIPRLPDTPIYVASYRQYGFGNVESIDVWPYPAVVGQPIPAVPLPSGSASGSAGGGASNSVRSAANPVSDRSNPASRSARSSWTRAASSHSAIVAVWLSARRYARA